MADRFPLILNTSTNQIQEIASGDNLDLTGTGISNAGIITAGNVTIGAATTDLIVNGNARVTGILTIGTSSLKLDGPNNLVNVGTALTLGHTQGLQFHTQNLHSAGFEVNQVNASGIITATGADINGDIDVDGHTNLDNVSVAGVSTFAGNADFSSGIDVTGDITGSKLTISSTTPIIDLSESDGNPDYRLFAEGGVFVLRDQTNTANRFTVTTTAMGVNVNLDAHAGLDVTGNATVSGNLSVGGVLTYEDVTNVDSVGIITARSSIKLDADGSASSNFLSIGADDDLKIFHQSNVDKIESSANGFHIRQINNGDLHIHAGANTGSANNRIVARAGGKAELYYGGNLKLTTETGGVNITGVCTATTFIGNLTGNVSGSQSGGSITATTGSFSGDATFNGGAGAISIGAGGDIRMSSGTWSGEYSGKIQYHSNKIYIQSGANGWQFRSAAGANVLELSPAGLITGGLSFANSVNFNSGGPGAITIAAGGDIRMVQGNWTGEYAGKIQYHSNKLYIQGGTSGHQLRDNSGGTTFEINPSGSCAGVNLSFSQDCQFAGGASAVSIAGGSDIRLSSGGWTGNAYGKIQNHNQSLYICGGSTSDYSIILRVDGADKIYMKDDGTFYPTTNNQSDLGTSSYRWKNIYTMDLNLSNEGGVNDVDGTWGNYTIQEGESDLFLINNRSGKKYKFNLTEVS